MRRTRSVAAGVLLAVAATLGVANARHPQVGTVTRPRDRSDRAPLPGAPAAGLVLRLAEGAEEGSAPALVARPPAERLADADARRVLDRLAPLAAEPREEAFAAREPSLPPPRAGRPVQASFPPEEERGRPDVAPAGALEVVRRMPEGDVPLAPHLAITFSQPMVAVSSPDRLARETVPARLVPQPPGEWRWVGTRTLLFEPTGRFPMATDYRVEVPAGTRATGGSALERDVAWSFSTPPPRLLTGHPRGGPARRDALLFALFDQAVDPDAVLASAHLAAGGQTFAVRLASSDEIGADETVARLVKQAEPGRWVAFRPERDLPAEAQVKVTIGVGTPSAEGPRRTSAAQDWAFRTYGPFRVRSHECGWRGRCTPFDPWRIELTNPVDAKSVGKELVRVEPELPGLKVEAWGDALGIRGTPRGRATYHVSLSSGIRDIFGQPLEPGPALAFAVGAAPPTLYAPGGDFVVLDPAGPKAFTVLSVNHESLRVLAWAVGPGDWAAWQGYRQRAWRNEAGAVPPGRLVIDTTLRVGGEPDAVAQTSVDLAPAFVGGLGQVVLVVRPTTPAEPRRREAVETWVQSTRIGLDAFADRETLVAWVNDLADGRPLADVDLNLARFEATKAMTTSAPARSDAGGLARLALGDAPAPLLVARRGGDVAILPSQTGWWSEGSGWRRTPPADTLRFFVFDDRGLYRPGEEVRVKGWVRRIGAGPRGDVEALPPPAGAVAWTLRDAQGNEVGKGEAPLARLGSFDLSLKLPATMNLGRAVLHLEAGPASLAGSHDHRFEVQEFRRPEFEVKAAAGAGPFLVGGAATVTISASYYSGGGLPGAEVAWRVRATPATFRPPNRDGFVFGTFVPWWESRPPPQEPARVETMTARTDGSGVHRLRIDFERSDPPRPHLVRAEATVMDVNRQAWTAGADLLVHPSECYVGLRAERAFVEKGERIGIDVIATDLEGGAIPGRPVRMRVERIDWEQVAGEWKEVPKDVRESEARSAAQPVRVGFEAKEGGTWRVLARVADERGRDNETELRVWVAGGRVPPRRDVEEERVTLVPDRSEYGPGDVAKVLVMAPFAPAEGILTLRRSGLVREERFTVTGGSHTLEIPIEDGFTPDVHVQVDLVGQAARDAAKGGKEKVPLRPAFASGGLDLPVPPASRTLALAVVPHDKALAPGGETVLDVALRDAAGRPVASGEAAVVVVDEAVLALTGYRLPDPLSVFYAKREAEVSDHRLRSHVLLARPDDLARGAGVSEEAADRLGGLGYVQGAAAMAAPSPGAAPLRRSAKAMANEERATEPIRARTDFSALAVFAASVSTDAEGHARVPVKLPDSLTRYRVMAVAAAGPRSFGSGESTIVARLPLMVRPSAPRFLNFGDRFELPVVVQNQTDHPMTVDVAVRARNAALTAGAGRRLAVAANDRAEVRFPMAAVRAGAARIQVGAASGSAADAAEVDMPVWTPATTEAFATYGQIDDGPVVQPVKAPPGAVPEFGGLEVTTSSTALQALTDAVLYLVAYPFECAEQLSSRVLAVAALRDVLGAFQAEGLPRPEEIEAAVRRDVDRLRAVQNDDGGFGFWRRGEESWPYVSIHVAHALARARLKGFPVPDAALDRSRQYLREMDRHIPPEYGKDVRRTLQAYALSVRALLGDADPGRARALVREAGVEGLSFEALAWVLPVLSKDAASAAETSAIRRRLANNVAETAAAAHFAVSYGDGAHLLLHSDRRADAIVLEALVADQPGSDLIPKLVEGLLAHRTAGRWTNTQENVFVLLALDRYFQAYEKTTPDFVARAWLGDRYAGSHAFRGRTTERNHLAIAMPYLREAKGAADLVLAKEGPGRLYYRIGLRYAPESLVLEPLDRGFAVERAYEGADDPNDVRRDPDGTWRMRAGSRVRVRLTMVAPARRYHVALVDPLPAGLEALNPALALTGSLPGDGGSEVTPVGAPGLGGPLRPGHWWWWSRPWFDHQNLRDERVEAFSALLWEGVHTYRYVARATTPGTFVVPPPKAEEMYAPETFGRGATDRVVVE
ncbi:MAG TPA: alpha-2-macroglobulin family protein [Vicinamibacteria bacterium]|nr:alpha-2-macroglobulin family protein [Vicinamibacteria bacterium]